MRRGSWLPLLVIAVLFLVGGAIVALSLADSTDDEVSSLTWPPGSVVHGATLGEWSARHWQWTLSFTVSGSPGYDTSGSSCGAGQSGPVHFIPRNLAPCMVPEGVSVLLPIVGVECSTVDRFPFAGGDEETLRACAAREIERYTNVSITVDGVPIPAIDEYRASTPLFNALLPEGNILAVPQGSAWVVADGYQVLLRPLSPGEHTIIVHSELEDGTVLPDKLLILTVVSPSWEPAPPAAPAGTPGAPPVPGDSR